MSMLSILCLIMFSCLCVAFVSCFIIMMQHRVRMEEIERTKELEKQNYTRLCESSYEQTKKWLGEWGQ